MKNVFCCLLFLIIGYKTFSQSFKYRKYQFKWPSEKPSSIPVEEQFKKHDALILEERCIYNAGGVRVPSYYYLASNANYFYIDNASEGLSPIVVKYVRIKFLTQNGIKKYSKIVLPESFDPSSDWSTVLPENRDSIYRPKGEFECIQYFAARIIKSDGKIINAVTDESVQTEIRKRNKIDEKFYNWIFRILNLEPGDELELNYCYEGAFNIDPSCRIFFNGELAKQNYHLTFEYPYHMLYMITCNNGAEPQDTIINAKGKAKHVEYHFTKRNLAGGIRECGARPHKELPYITYYVHKSDFGIQDPVTKFITKPLPYPWTYILLPLVDYQYEDLAMRMKRKDKTTLALNKFLGVERQKAKDTSLAGIMSSIQHTLAEEFEYQRDLYDYLAGDGELEHLGKYMNEKTMREISRLRIYSEIMTRLDKDYFAVALFDKRIAEMDFERYEHLTGFRRAFAVPYNKSFIYLYPKSYRYGFEANELPFYYEDSRTALIPQHEPSYKKYELVPSLSISFLKTPFSGLKDNLRSTNAMVNVSLDSLQLSFNIRVKLAGQFSTITRGYYLYGDRDTTVTPAYYHTVTSLSEENKKAEVKITSLSTQFPYDANIVVHCSNQHSLKKENDGLYSIDLEDWFNNVIDEDFNASTRQLSYYPDFQYQDFHKYMVKFNRKVQLQNAEEFHKSIDNSFAVYSINATQVDEENIMLEARYIVKAISVPASKASEVENVFESIKNLNQSKLKVKVL